MSAAAPTKSRPAIRSPVYFALLGLVIERPGYGYGLLKRFERAYGELLPLSGNSHIYTALNALEDRGLIEELPEGVAEQFPCRRQRKPRYRATAEGERSHREWVIAHICEDRRQWRLFVRQLAIHALKPEGVQLLDACEQAWQRESAEQAAISSENGYCQRMPALVARLNHVESTLTAPARGEWLAAARHEFEALADTPQRSLGCVLR